MGYLTPDTIPTDTICRVLFIPNDREFIANVTGALQLLTIPAYFEQYGMLTPEQTADAYVDMFDRFCFNEGTCRVIGEIVVFAGAASPDPKWIACDGASYLRADYPDLFTVIGATFGAVDSTHFNVPDMRGRAPSGTGTGTGLTAVTLGQQYGEETHVLTTAEIPSHTHTDIGHVHTEGIALPAVGAAIVGVPVPSAVPSVGVTGIGSASLLPTGGDGGHNTIGPRLGLTYLIVALP